MASQLRSGVSRIFSSLGAFAALKADGSVVTWGPKDFGGDSSAVASQLRSGVSRIFSTDRAFAALKADGSVVTWGSKDFGGDSSAVASQLRSGVSKIVSSSDDFVALKADGSALSWPNNYISQRSSGVSQILINFGIGYAALKTDGSVVTWGSQVFGGNSSGVASQLRSGVSQIFSSKGAFAALKTDGSVVTWGTDHCGVFGGDSSAVASQLRSGVSQICSTGSAFAALKADGSVVTWGDTGSGGDSSAVASQLRSGVSQIFSSHSLHSWYGAFAALKADGSVVTWGSKDFGGDSSAVASQLSSGVTQIFSSGGAFAALKADGSVVTWGPGDKGGDSSAVASQLRSGVVGFADPFTDDWLIPTPPIEPVTLTISPSTLKEDGTSNLVYTFSRTDTTASSLTVNYSIAGSADAADYTGATPGTGKTISFAPGSATATLTINPTADSVIEPDETVALTLESGTGYTIGTSTAVVGTIANDDFNSAPTALSLSTTNFAENIPASSAVANLTTTDPDAGNTFTYSLVPGSGSADNAAFAISGNQLKIIASPNFEAKSAYSIRVRTTDQGGLFFEKNLTLTVTNANEQPTDIAASSLNFAENIPAGSTVANLSTTDPDAGNTFTYALVPGAGSNDNGAFKIDGNQLRITTSPDFETKSSYTIRVRSTDANELSLEKSITLNVKDIQEGNASPTPVPPDPSAPLELQPGRTCSLPGLRDYDGILHGGAPDSLKDSIAADYRFQGFFSLRRDGLQQALFTNRSSGRWASAAVDPLTRQIDYADHGKGGITRIVGIYIDVLVQEGELNTSRPGFLLNGEKAPERFGPFDSQRRFQNDLVIDNLSARLSGDFDRDGIQELYWKVNDGTAYLRSLLHDDGNIRYANYQSRDQMSSYLTSNGHADLIAAVL